MKEYKINNRLIFTLICGEYLIEPQLALENEEIYNLLLKSKNNKNYKQHAKAQKELRKLLQSQF